MGALMNCSCFAKILRGVAWNFPNKSTFSRSFSLLSGADPVSICSYHHVGHTGPPVSVYGTGPPRIGPYRPTLAKSSLCLRMYN